MRPGSRFGGDTYAILTLRKSPFKLRTPSSLSCFDSPSFGTLTHPSHTFGPDDFASLTTPVSLKCLMISPNNTLLSFATLFTKCRMNGCFVRENLCKPGRFKVDGCGGGMGSAAFLSVMMSSISSERTGGSLRLVRSSQLEGIFFVG
jgi:hypothetical protein